MTMGIMALKIKCCHRHGFLAQSPIIVAIVLEGLSSRLKTRDTRQSEILSTINVVLTDINRQIVDCLMDIGKKLSRTSRVKLWLNMYEFFDKRCK